MYRCLPFLVLLLFVPRTGAAQTDSLSTDDKIADLRERVLPLRSVDPADEDFSDLAALKQHIGDRRIVILGDATHGDGTALEAKGRLIKFLHQEMDFGVLAFESGLYDLRVTTGRAASASEHLEATTSMLARPWADSKQVRPTLRYCAETQSTNTPLRVTGIDGALHPPNDSLFAAQLKRHLDGRGVWEDVAEGTNFEQTLRRQMVNPLALARDTVGYNQFVSRMDSLIEPLEVGSSEDVFWALMLENVKAQAETGFQRSYDPRNRQMAHSIEWLAEEEYAGEKIIVWIATSHGVRNLSSLEVDGEQRFEGHVSVGDRLADIFDDGIYTLGMATFGGEQGAFYWSDPVRTIEAPRANSLEALMGALPYDYSLLNFTDVPETHWLSTPQIARPMGYREMRADWTEVIDALLFIRTMEPNTRLEQ